MKYSTYTKQDITQELLQLKTMLGRFPTGNDIHKHKPTLGNAIYKNGLKLSQFRKEIQGDFIKRPNGYWQDFHNLSAAIKPLIKNNVFPTLSTIAKMSGGAREAVRDFGGLRNVAKQMGYNLCTCYQASDGHYLRSSYEYLVDEFLTSRKIPHEVDGKISPKHNYRYDFKVGDYFVEIWGLTARKEYEEKRKIKERLYCDLGLKCVSVESHLFEQSSEEIDSSLSAIFLILGFCTAIKTPFYMGDALRLVGFWNEARIIEELKKIIHNGTFPTQKEMLNTSGLAGAVSKHGGISRFKKLMGFD